MGNGRAHCDNIRLLSNYGGVQSEERAPATRDQFWQSSVSFQNDTNQTRRQAGRSLRLTVTATHPLLFAATTPVLRASVFRGNKRRGDDDSQGGLRERCAAVSARSIEMTMAAFCARGGGREGGPGCPGGMMRSGPRGRYAVCPRSSLRVFGNDSKDSNVCGRQLRKITRDVPPKFLPNPKTKTKLREGRRTCHEAPLLSEY